MKPQRKIQADIWKEHGIEVHNKYFDQAGRRGKKLVAFLKEHKEVKSVCEIGCSAGHNLLYIAQNTENINLYGIEINAAAVSVAQNNVPMANIRRCDVHNMRAKEKYDLIFTGAVLMHIPPDDIKKVMKKCIDRAKKYIIHMEPVGNNIVDKGPVELNPRKIRKMMKCSHDIVGLYKELGFDATAIHESGDPEPFIIIKARK